jgi:dTDP-4-dehydrorhamnose reductase
MNSTKNKKVLITGASGMLGSNVCTAFNNIYSVTGTYNSCTSNISNTNNIKLDVSDKRSCKEVIAKIKPNVVIHCAAITDLEVCEVNTKLAFEVNAYGTKNVLDAIDRDCHFIYISTDNVYNNGKMFNREGAKKNTTNIYGETKRKAEQIIMKSKLKYTILRTNIFGWSHAENKSGFLNYIYDNLKDDNPITLFHDVHYTPIGIPDFVSGMAEIIIQSITGTYNYGGYERISKLDFGLIVADIFKLDKRLIIPTSLDEKHFIAQRPKEMSMDSRKIFQYIPQPKEVRKQLADLYSVVK